MNNYKEMTDVKLLPQFSDVPVIKTYSSKGELVTDPRKMPWRQFEKPMYLIAMAVAAIAVLYGTAVYAIPAAFTIIGQVGGAIISTLLALFTFMAWPVMAKFMRRVVRKMNLWVIKWDPIGELKEQLDKLIAKINYFKSSKIQIRALGNTAQENARQFEVKSKEAAEKLLTLQADVKKSQSERDNLLKKYGSEDAMKQSDEYIPLQTTFVQLNSSVTRATREQQSYAAFAIKYGMRANSIRKFLQKINLYEVVLMEKQADFELFIDQVKNDLEFAQTGASATGAMKQAMMFSSTGEAKEVIDIINATIAADLARMTENMMDLDQFMTGQVSLDNDVVFAKLDKWVADYESGEIEVPNTEKYKNTEYKPTPEDKKQAGAFGDLF